MSTAETALFVRCTEVGKGQYMLILQNEIRQVGMLKFRNMFFCARGEETYCTKINKHEGAERMMKATNMIRSYAKKEGIDARAYFVQHYLEKHDKIIYGCMIGPLYAMSEEESNKLEQYAINEIPDVASDMIGYQRKYCGRFEDSTFTEEAVRRALRHDMEEALIDNENMKWKDTENSDNMKVMQYYEDDCCHDSKLFEEIVRNKYDNMNDGCLETKMMMCSQDEDKENVEPCTFQSQFEV